MAQILIIKLTRSDTSCPWGFRLQGGKDFGTPLLIQKVNAGSIAEKTGMKVGDALLRVNNTDVSDQVHKEAQDAIVHAGNSFEVTVQRGGTTIWKPNVIPIGSVPSPNSRQPVSPTPVTKTSLTAANRQPSLRMPSGFNSSSKPYLPQANDGYVNENGPIKAIVNKQYNTPVGMYSDESIAETLSAQAEVLAGGVLGVNFKKNEKSYNADSSEVFKMVQQDEKESKSNETADTSQNGVIPTPVVGLRHVSAPQSKFPASQSSSKSGQNICADCERLIVGVFVRIKDTNLHVECFKCATCGTSLKNIGYYSINNKLYCDIHAKMVARQNPSTLNSTNQRADSKTVASALTNATTNLLSPQSPKVTPIPFQNVSNLNGIKPVLSNQFHNVSELKTDPNLTGRAAGGGGGSKYGTSADLSAPRRGKGVWNPQNVTPGARIPLCAHCISQIRGPFITALGKIWCPEHFVCINEKCNRSLLDIGFVEEPTGLYCEYCFEQYLAPICAKCSKKVKGDCLNAVGKHFHPECFTCAHCGKLFSNSPFFLEEGLPYCENDWNELFTTKCFTCGFPIEAGDRWVEALNHNYHSPCFNCTMCKTNLEGQSFYAKGGRPFCKNHNR